MADSRTVVLTGATKGLGRAMTARLVEDGHTVIGCGRSLAAIKQLESEHGGLHRFDCVDVVSDDEVSAWAASVIDQFGPPDLLLNNAATINRNACLWELPADEFDPVIDVNIKGVANVLRHFVPSMVVRQSGIIVNFSSGWGRSTSAEVAPYCATKWAIEGLTQALAQELPRKSISGSGRLEPLRCAVHSLDSPVTEWRATQRSAVSKTQRSAVTTTLTATDTPLRKSHYGTSDS